MDFVIIGPTLLTRACIEAIGEKHNIIAVFTLDENVGRGKCRYAKFEDQAEKYDFKLYAVEKINAQENIDLIRSLAPEIIFEAGWSEVIDPEILNIPPKGTIGIHGAPLPEIRGKASLNWALIWGKDTWGVSLYYLTAKPDQGNILGVKYFDIAIEDDIRAVHEKSDKASADLIREHLAGIETGSNVGIPQDLSGGILTKARRPEDGWILWEKPVAEIYNWIRAQSKPFPGAFTFYQGKKIKMWSADYRAHPSADMDPGTVREVSPDGVIVATGQNSILIKEMSVGDGPIEPAYEIAIRNDITAGNRFG